MLDVTTEWGKHVEQRLQSNIIAWLTTVGGDGRPYTVPVGFVWEGQTLLIFSQPKKTEAAEYTEKPTRYSGTR
jgi:nitroimidazol reductase NimA-like FMN-containing flavoprotein (pyridoxamine 5'-phosphate oxidase superfamily)